MARRAVAPTPNPANQAGRSTAQLIKKAPKAIIWVAGIFALFGLILAGPFGVFGKILTWAADPTRPLGVFFLMMVGFFAGISGIYILFLRFAGFEDVQEAGRSVLASAGIGILAALLVRWLAPLFNDHDSLLRLFMAGILATAIMSVVNLYTKFEYKHMIGWGATLIAAAFICLLAVNGTDGKGFELKSLNPFGGSNNTTEEHVPRDVWLSRANPVLYFNNISERSDVFRVSSASKRFAWELDESSACGNVIVNGRYPLRNICPGRGTLDLQKEVLLPGEGTTIFQFVGKGMSGKVVSTW